jgi:hypothetical protein
MMNILDCCAKPAQHNLHEKKHELNEQGRYVAALCWNRLCSSCYTHWYGHPDNLKRYTRQEWDALINTAFDEEPARLA